MAYILNQFNQPMTKDMSASDDKNKKYMEVILGGTAKRKKNASDSGVSGVSLKPFFDECVQFDSALAAGTNYYFHAKIKRMNSNQIFYIYLCNYAEEAGVENKKQYLKTITVQSGMNTEWVDFELIFTPLLQFDCILFELQRNIEDITVKENGVDENGKIIYERVSVRYPVIVYEELSLIKNIIPNKTNYIKIGVQSHPGLMMCINGEEIHVGRTGTYEVRNGIITVEFFSVVKAAIEDYNGGTPLELPDGTRATIEQYLNYLANLAPVETADATNSKCIFRNSKLRSIDAFTLDYMYEEVKR